MVLQDYLNLVSAVIVSIGGGSVVIFGLSNFLGKVWANRILEKDKKKYGEEMEELKSQYSKELENHRLNIEKAKAMFVRYSEKQFILYNDLWVSLYELREKADDLWDNVTMKSLTQFAKQLKKTISDIEKNRILLEDNHYILLVNITQKFKDFEVGKKKLIQFTDENNMDGNEIILLNSTINSNRMVRKEYVDLLEEICNSFRRQIREI